MSGRERREGGRARDGGETAGGEGPAPGAGARRDDAGGGGGGEGEGPAGEEGAGGRAGAWDADDELMGAFGIDAGAPVQKQEGPGRTAAASRPDRVANQANQGGAADRTPSSATPTQFPLAATEPPQARHAAAATRLALIQTSIDAEDSPTARSTGATKDDRAGHERVDTQLARRHPGVLAAALAAQQTSQTGVGGTDQAAARTAVQAFEAAVRRLQDAYETTYLVSTDAPAPTTRWSNDLLRDTLSGPRDRVRERLRTWSPTPTAYVKFAIPAASPDEVRVGVEPYSHLDIAGGNALAAGLLRFDVSADPIQVSEVENVSGGFRPGPLRNALVLERLIALGFAHADLSGTSVHHSATGRYQGSAIAPRP